MKIGFIGCGNMASAIIDGIIKNEITKENDISIFDVFFPAVESITSKYNVNLCEKASDIVRSSDAVILAVKPNVIASVLDEINYSLEESNTLIISIAAGKTIDFIRNTLSHDNRIIRVMPNINAKVGEAISAYTANSYATKEDKALCEKLFGGVGKVMYLDEEMFPLFGVIAGCSPAFAYMFIDSLARAGVKNGMKKETALFVAAQAVLGSAKMILESNEHPWELVDKVCSPGGTTIEGVASLQQDGFENSVINAVDKAVDKDKKL
ncbi:MAG: pyrroline-5-carboxylate reductase [Eubacterium sp.]|nr:pyrroline-5-carboxylate reductase [Eubacterium sp.]